MARDFDASVPEKLTITGLSGEPAAVTLAMWGDCDARDTAGTFPLKIGNGSDGVWLKYGGSGDDRMIGRYHDDMGGFPIIQGGDAVGVGWTHGCFVCDPGSSHQELYQDGISLGTGTDADAIDYGASGDTYIGGYNVATGDYDGRIAEAAFWNRALSDEEAAALGAGYSPLFFPEGLIIYIDLIRDIYDHKGNSISATGTTVTDHPRIIYPAPAAIAYLVATAAIGNPGLVMAL